MTYTWKIRPPTLGQPQEATDMSFLGFLTFNGIVLDLRVRLCRKKRSELLPVAIVALRMSASFDGSHEIWKGVKLVFWL